MGDAIWLFLALPKWYFSDAGVLSALGIVSLVVGAAWGLVKRRLGLLLFVLLLAASQILVVVAGFMRGSLRHLDLEPALYAFVLLQIAVAAYFIFRLKGARLPAAALAIFTSTYAYLAAFAALMAFTDRWI